MMGQEPLLQTEQIQFQFHLRNFNARNMRIGVYHAGCGGAPWHDDRPNCWGVEIPNNPTGGANSVYVPDSWVTNFADWMNVIVDAVKLVGDLAIFIESEGEDAEALAEAIADISDITKDAALAEADRTGVNLEALAQQVKANFAQVCQNAGLTPEQVTSIADRLALDGSWAFIAGDTYIRNFHDDGQPITDQYGWSVFMSEANAQNMERIANHAFIHKGHIIQVVDDAVMNQLWKYAPEAGHGYPTRTTLHYANKGIKDGTRVQLVDGANGNWAIRLDKNDTAQFAYRAWQQDPGRPDQTRELTLTVLGTDTDGIQLVSGAIETNGRNLECGPAGAALNASSSAAPSATDTQHTFALEPFAGDEDWFYIAMRDEAGLRYLGSQQGSAGDRRELLWTNSIDPTGGRPGDSSGFSSDGKTRYIFYFEAI
jgi:hypothetical protein